MKREKNEEPLKDVIDRLLKVYRLEDGFTSAAIKDTWEELMGKTISRHTEEVKLYKGRLVVRLNSAPLRQELTYSKDKIKDMLNKKLGKDVVDHVELR